MRRTTIKDTRRQVVASIGYVRHPKATGAVAETDVALKIDCDMQSLELASSKGFGEEVFVILCASKSLVDAVLVRRAGVWNRRHISIAWK